MITLQVKDSSIIICLNEKIIVYNLNDGVHREITLPDINVPKDLSENQKNALKNEKQIILTATFSNCGKYFGVCTLNKQLVLYDTEFKVAKNVNVCRGVSKIRFTPSGNILIADKTGDAYIVEINDNKEEDVKPKELLGHLSMLLDVVLTENEKYIITCDRDEKIRVSSYPNCYNIVSYCLGHSEYVSNVEFFDENTLISASGDGTIKFWEYLNGEELLSINTNENITDKSLIDSFISYMDKEAVEVSALPILDMKVAKMENNCFLIVVSIHNFNGLQVYKATAAAQVQLCQIIHVKSKIISFDLTKKYLFVLTDNDIISYNFENGCHNLKINDNLSEFFNKYKRLIQENMNKDNISVLYKRKYDNMQEYQERKKLRIENRKK